MKCLAAALGSAIASAVVIVSPVLAHAEGCDQWEFNGEFKFVTDAGSETFSVPAQGTDIDGSYSLDSTPNVAPVRGKITGNTVSLAVAYVASLWTGQIDPAGNVSGTGEGIGTPNSRWHSVGAPLLCKATPLPAPQITLRYDAPTLVGITGWVGMTNNAGKPAVDCTYSDGLLPPRPLSVYGDKETRIDLPGIPSGHVYNITVKCGDLTHTEQKQF
ncbi:hypothetical protein [Mycolicibacterium stellerae]|uniref:hypothetical protein n=1 Tax=Mycolicibacterium stellerae TaxID=2358193 RepID=UPI0013DE253C|nr:hypothetical protein [Mycolicibacterium stellerae]